MKNIIERIIFGALLFGLLFLIYSASFQSGEASSGLSALVCDIINGWLRGTGITVSEYFVRKAAHFSEYAVLGLLLCQNRRVWKERFNASFPLLLLIGLLIPVSDEFLQYFRPGRGSMVPDVLLYFSGFVTGLLCSVLIAQCNRRGRRLRRPV